jgi:hypothetical protein
VEIVNGIIRPVREPDVTIVLDDPLLPGLRKKQLEEVASGVFPLNGIKRYRALVGGGKMVLQGWGG